MTPRDIALQIVEECCRNDYTDEPRLISAIERAVAAERERVRVLEEALRPFAFENASNIRIVFTSAEPCGFKDQVVAVISGPWRDFPDTPQLDGAVKTARAALAGAAAEGDGWLPGSSAPRDGTEFIGAEYCGPEDEGDPMWLRDLHDAHWNVVKSGFTNGWGDLVTITHWRPSFPPPSAGAIGRERVQVAEGDGWLPIADAIHAKKLLLGWYEPTGEWDCVVGQASWGWRNEVANNMSHHGRATHWRPLPLPPSAGAKEGETT